MIKEVENFKREELFKHYHSCNNPFMICTTKIDVTNIVNYCKEHKHFYATLGYLITKTVNQIDNFKYRYKDGKIYYCDIIKSNYTQMYEDETIGYFDIPPIEDYNEYIDEYIKVQDRFYKDKEYMTENDLDEIWLSCNPWLSFSGFVPPFNKEISIPQFIWDKYKEENGKYSLNLMVMIHHGLADGYHVRKIYKSITRKYKYVLNKSTSNKTYFFYAYDKLEIKNIKYIEINYQRRNLWKIYWK